jgi:hypothetical protein
MPAPIPCEPPVTMATFCPVSLTASPSHVSVLMCLWSQDRLARSLKRHAILGRLAGRSRSPERAA